MTEIPSPHVKTFCKKNPICKYLGSREEKNICLKGTQFSPAIIQLELHLSKESDGEEISSGDNCVGIDSYSDDITVPAM